MLRLTRLLTKTLSARLSLMVVSVTAMLFLVAHLAMAWFSRQSVKEEAMLKASHMLQATVEHIEGTLDDVETIARNMRWNVEHSLDEPDKLYFFSKKLLELNQNIAGCAIALEPYFYGLQKEYFMAYSYRSASSSQVTENTPIMQAEVFGNRPYTEQVWYSKPVDMDQAYWTEPLIDNDNNGESIVTYCLPVHDRNGRAVGVLALDITLDWLSHLVLSTRISPHSYCALLGRNGDYIVHPDSEKLQHQNVFQWQRSTTDADSSVVQVAMAMMAGETGHQRATLRLDSAASAAGSVATECLVFYKPVKGQGWSAAIVYPEDEILSDYHQLWRYTAVIALVSMLLLVLLCVFIVRRQLAPLRLLTEKAQRIAQGHYDETVPDSHQHDEVGRLQASFSTMQQSLAARMGELRHLTVGLKQRGEVLSQTYEQARQADSMKTAFLRNMTNQMSTPISIIRQKSRQLCSDFLTMEPQQAQQLSSEIQQQAKTVAALLNDLLEESENTSAIMIDSYSAPYSSHPNHQPQ